MTNTNTVHLAPKPIPLNVEHISTKSSPTSPAILHGNVSDLVALDPDVEVDVRHFVSGQAKARAKVGHELIKPTGEKFVFVLQMEEQEEHVATDIGNEAKKDAEKFIHWDGEAEHDGDKKLLEVDIETEDEGQIELSNIGEGDEEPAAPLMCSFDDADFMIVSDALSNHNSNGAGQHESPPTVTRKTESNQPRLPRTSNGPSLASLIGLAKASDFDPEPNSSSSTSQPADALPQQTSGLRHSSKGPSLAALIASADPADFPLPDSDSDPESEFGVEKTKDQGGHIVREYEYPYQYAFVVLRERFEVRIEGGDGGGARAWAGKKNKLRKEWGLLRDEWSFDGDGKKNVSIRFSFDFCTSSRQGIRDFGLTFWNRIRSKKGLTSSPRNSESSAASEELGGLMRR